MGYLSQNREAREARKQKLLPLFSTSYAVREGVMPPVPLAQLLASDAFGSAETVSHIPLGVDANGQAVICDLQTMRHILVSGATGTGKSVFLHSLILSLIYEARPEEVKLILVDPKRVELAIYRGAPHLLLPPITDMHQVMGALSWAASEMKRREALLKAAGVDTIQAYNDAVADGTLKGELMPRLVIAVDEMHDLVVSLGIAFEISIMYLAQKAHEVGIHLVLCTQRPAPDVITEGIKACIPSRIAFRVSSEEASHTILDASGAETLRGRGDMLAVVDGKEPIRLQGAYISDDEIVSAIARLLEEASFATYDESILAIIHAEAEKYRNSAPTTSDVPADDSIFEDKRFIEACQVAIENGQVSTSLLQRRCSLGYGRAAKYLDIMESLGIVSPPSGAKPREVLMTREQFMTLAEQKTQGEA